MFSFSSNIIMEYSERFQRNNDKINTKIYLLVKPRRDSNSQPRGYHGSIQLSYWAYHFNQLNFTKNEKSLQMWRMDSHHRPPAFITVALATELLHLIQNEYNLLHESSFKSSIPSRADCLHVSIFYTYLIKENCRCRCRTRICDLWLMRPTSYQLLQPAIWQPILTNELQRKQFNKVIYIKINETKQVIIWR